ncbi:hypothetical protein BGP75_12255 [Motiliproteus sp. MSK22-1]|nr:hypothetical protein BGP75_12255 [Motiliproteus sp. MSK22-1]
MDVNKTGGMNNVGGIQKAGDSSISPIAGSQQYRLLFFPVQPGSEQRPLSSLMRFQSAHFFLPCEEFEVHKNIHILRKRQLYKTHKQSWQHTIFNQKLSKNTGQQTIESRITDITKQEKPKVP